MRKQLVSCRVKTLVLVYSGTILSVSDHHITYLVWKKTVLNQQTNRYFVLYKFSHYYKIKVFHFIVSCKHSLYVILWCESTWYISSAGGDKVADVYMEGTDQFGGWFQSSLLTSVALQDRAPYRYALLP